MIRQSLLMLKYLIVKIVEVKQSLIEVVTALGLLVWTAKQGDAEKLLMPKHRK